MLAVRVFRAFARKAGKGRSRKAMHAFLCDDLPFEMDLLHFLRMGLEDAGQLRDLAHPVVFAIEGYQKRVLRTLHKMLETRFEELADGSLYARIEPPRNVLPMMGRHFAERFGREDFTIRDVKRFQALLYAQGSLKLRTVHAWQEPELSPDEQTFQKLWNIFFDEIAIKDRINPALQRNFVPIRYRRWMTEFQG